MDKSLRILNAHRTSEDSVHDDYKGHHHHTANETGRELVRPERSGGTQNLSEKLLKLACKTAAISTLPLEAT